MKEYISKLSLFVVISVYFAVAPCFALFEPQNESRFFAEMKKSGVFMNDSIIGVWSGKHITLEISEDGANVEYDCATGKIVGKIKLDKNNSFSILGTYLEEKGGPIRPDDSTKAITVRFSGQIKGKKMNLVVRRNDTKKLIGKFILYYNREPYLVKCR